MRQGTEEKLETLSAPQRKLYWIELLEKLRAGRTKDGDALTPEELRRLGSLASDEIMEHPDDKLLPIAIAVSLEGICASVKDLAGGILGKPAEARQPAELGAEECLFDWILKPFHAKSAVFGTLGGGVPRDSNALLELARCISFKEFPLADIRHVPLHSTEWEERVFQHNPQAVLFVGRLGLFGEKAIADWRYKNARFGFLSHVRPENCNPPPFDPQYHCICEKPDDGPPVPYLTSETNGVRTDYALIQRYSVQCNNRQIIVVNCPGITSLGTLGAALYLVKRLNCPSRQGGQPIPLPPDIRDDSSLEALLEVRADATKQTWTISQVELRKLFVDNAVWSVSANKWESLPTISLVCADGDPQRPLFVRFDSREEKMDRKGQAFKLLAAVCLQARENPKGPIDLTKLAQQSSIWESNEKVDALYIKRQLSLLKNRHLSPESLTIGDEVRLHAKVVIAADSQSAADEDVLPKRKRRRPDEDGPAPSKPRPR